MSNSKHLVGDISAKKVFENFKRVLIGKCHRLKNDGYLDREIIEELEDYYKKLSREQEELASSIQQVFDGSVNGSLFNQIEKLPADCNCKNEPIEQFKSHIDGTLYLTISVRENYEGSHKKAISMIDGLVKDCGHNEKILKRLLLKAKINTAYKTHRKNSVKLVEIHSTSSFINEVKERGLDVVLEESSLPDGILNRIDDFARRRTDKPNASKPLFTELEKMRVTNNLIYKGDAGSKVLNISNNVGEIKKNLNWDESTPSSDTSLRKWTKKYAEKYKFFEIAE